MAVSRTVFVNKARLWSKDANFSYPLYLTCTIPENTFEFLLKNLIQTAKVPGLIVQKYYLKVRPSDHGARTLQTDRRLTDDRRRK